jgi:hypothetical protein
VKNRFLAYLRRVMENGNSAATGAEWRSDGTIRKKKKLLKTRVIININNYNRTGT